MIHIRAVATKLTVVSGDVARARGCIQDIRIPLWDFVENGSWNAEAFSQNRLRGLFNPVVKVEGSPYLVKIAIVKSQKKLVLVVQTL
jgi:hypothetical protein